MAYCNVTQQEMESFLLPKGYASMVLPNTIELVYGKVYDATCWYWDQEDKPITLKMSLRIYTGINPDGNSRDIGKDAIRVGLYWRDNNSNVYHIASSRRVHRVNGWRDNLEDRIVNWQKGITGRACPRCYAPLIERINRFNGDVFLACPTWTKTKCPGR